MEQEIYIRPCSKQTSALVTVLSVTVSSVTVLSVTVLSYQADPEHNKVKLVSFMLIANVSVCGCRVHSRLKVGYDCYCS
uniref:7TM_GPCR_Srx domain-containing protein n=1 Tax=Steinernema glaseri TaxID=37863 RepID=A0A1I7Y370_9BILA